MEQQPSLVCIFDVRVLYRRAHSYRSLQVPVVYRNHERQKRSEYEERIRDKGSFTPLVFSSSGGAGPAATTMLKRLADKMTTSYVQRSHRLLAVQTGLRFPPIVGPLLERC